jgi:hypothetical protein
MKKFCYLLFILPYVLFGQTLYNPQVLYDAPGGLYEPTSLLDLYIDFQDPNYHSVLADSFYTNPTYRISATVTLNGVAYDSVGIRYKGNSTFVLPNDNGSPKVPYNLDFNYWVSGQKLMNYKKVKLANGWLDPTFAKEYLASTIYQKYLPTPQVSLMKLNVQGSYLGLYVNTEAINKQFSDKHFDEKSGVLFKCDPVQVFGQESTSNGEPNLNWLGTDSTSYYDSYVLKSEHGWEELMGLIYTLNYNSSELDSVLNIDRVLWAFAVNSVIANLDTYNGWYIHNYYLYRTKDGLFQMIPWDLSESFGGALMGNVFATPNDIYHFDPYFGNTTNPQSNPLLYTLLNEDLYKKQYTAHVRTILDESLDTAFLRSQVSDLQLMAYAAANSDSYKPFSISDYSSNVENAFWSWDIFWGFAGIFETIDERKDYLLNHPDISQVPPSISNLSVDNNQVTVNVFNANNVELMATVSEYNSKFQAFNMYDDGSNGDVLSGDGVYTCDLPFSTLGQTVKFYVRAQNDDAMQLDPQRAEYEFYMYSPSSVDVSPELFTVERSLLKIMDVLGREVHQEVYNTPLLYLYDDGTVEKRIIMK